MVLRMVGMLQQAIPNLAVIIERDGSSRKRLYQALHEIGMSHTVFRSIMVSE